VHSNRAPRASGRVIFPRPIRAHDGSREVPQRAHVTTRYGNARGVEPHPPALCACRRTSRLPSGLGQGIWTHVACNTSPGREHGVPGVYHERDAPLAPHRCPHLCDPTPSPIAALRPPLPWGEEMFAQSADEVRVQGTSNSDGAIEQRREKKKRNGQRRILCGTFCSRNRVRRPSPQPSPKGRGSKGTPNRLPRSPPLSGIHTPHPLPFPARPRADAHE